MIRPRPARWFEALVARDDATIALEALAATGAVELEARGDASLPEAFAAVAPLLAQFAEFARAYRAYWPQHGLVASAFPEPPAAMLERDLARLRRWREEADPLVALLQQAQAERAELLLWHAALEGLGASPIPLDRLVADGSVRRACLLALPSGAALPDAPPRTLLRVVDVAGTALALAVGPASEVEALARETLAAQGRVHAMPAWLRASAAASLEYIAGALPGVEQRERGLALELDLVARKHGLHEALGDAQRLAWLLDNVRTLESGEHFCHVTGWTSARDPATLRDALERSGARALLHFAEPPAGARAPLLFANPAWARPFEVFARALGMPARDEVDPAVLLAFAVPLLFGYMFGDVGQGLVIAAAGFALRHRFALARLFVAGGLAAAAFGFAFGSAFSLHAFEPLWLDPLAHPLEVLAAPLAFGALLLVFGLLLAGLEAWWRGTLLRWLATDALLIPVFLGLLAALADPRALAVAAAAAIAFVAGHTIVARRAAAAPGALAELVERTLQLSINTLSFARVGAFALAHAGLSSAIVALMDIADSAPVRALVLVAGNAVVIVLEALIVSVQTTRLVLFEFFTRFLEAGGRAFRPLPPPPSLATGSAP
ncbi:MAG: ATPase [Betaproteobacteria bacterium]|nr:ATPase [Betaproteobacteria bacterium]